MYLHVHNATSNKSLYCFNKPMFTLASFGKRLIAVDHLIGKHQNIIRHTHENISYILSTFWKLMDDFQCDLACHQKMMFGWW